MRRHGAQRFGRIARVECTEDRRAAAGRARSRRGPPRQPRRTRYACRRATAPSPAARHRLADRGSGAAAAPAIRSGRDRRQAPRGRWRSHLEAVPARPAWCRHCRSGAVPAAKAAADRRTSAGRRNASRRRIRPGRPIPDRSDRAAPQPPRRARQSHRGGSRLLRRNHRRAAGFQDAGLLGSDLGQRVAEEMHMVHRDRGDCRHRRGRDQIGGVDAAHPSRSPAPRHRPVLRAKAR